MSQDFYEQGARRPTSRNLRPLLRLVPFALRYKGRIAVALVALLVAATATLVIPMAVRRVIDNGFSAANATLVDTYFLAMLAVGVTLAVSSATRMYAVTWLGERVVADVRSALFSHLLHLTPGFFETQRTGEVVSRLTADTTQIRSAFTSSASVALRNVVMLAGAIVMMVVTSPKLSGLALLAIPLMVLPLVTFGRRVRQLGRQAQDTLANAAALAQERLGAIATVQSNVQEEATGHHYRQASEQAFAAIADVTRARAFLTAAIITVVSAAIVGLLWFGAKEVIAGEMSGGTMGQFVIYAFIAASSLGQLSEVSGEVMQAAGAAGRIAELLDERPAVTAPAQPALLPEPPRGALRFEAISFSYPTRPSTLAMDHADFAIAPGETVALVGPSGAGKSTAFALIQRFFDPQLGRILLDGTDIRSVDPQALRSRLAVVPQESIIFSGSVMDNIRFGKPGASDAEAMAAARQAHVHEFATRLPKGYDTQVGERGATLSGGQRQRIAIARAILRNAPVLLLDEATSALDAESEAFIQEALSAATHNRTTLVIAHRLATVRNAHRILVFDHGRLVAQGRHGELVKKSPLYARLAKLQFNVPSA
jgi:ATP-binding cassette subfamily B protein